MVSINYHDDLVPLLLDLIVDVGEKLNGNLFFYSVSISFSDMSTTKISSSRYEIPVMLKKTNELCWLVMNGLFCYFWSALTTYQTCC